MDGMFNRRDKAAFLNFSDVVWQPNHMTFMSVVPLQKSVHVTSSNSQIQN